MGLIESPKGEEKGSRGSSSGSLTGTERSMTIQVVGKPQIGNHSKVPVVKDRGWRLDTFPLHC